MIALTGASSSLVANHRYAPAEDLLDALEAGEHTADDIATKLELSTRDVVNTLNMLAAGANPLVRRRILAGEEISARDGWRTLAARWELIR
jgi:hypothetical protein